MIARYPKITGNNTYHIHSMSDFPAPSAGVITLSTGVYEIHGALSTTNRFNVPDGVYVVFHSLDSYINGITITNASPAIYGDAIGTFISYGIYLSSPSGDLFDFTSGTLSAGSVFLDSSVFINCLGLGTISNQATVVLTSCAGVDIGTGLQLNGCSGIFFHFSQFYSWKNTATSMFDFNSGTFGSIAINACSFTTNTNIYAIKINSGITLTSGNISGSNFNGSAGGVFFNPAGNNQTNKYWTVKGNGNIKASAAYAQMELNGNTTVSVITTVNVPVLVAGTWTDVQERFTTTSSGRAIYDGLEEVSLAIYANPTFVTDTGSNKDIGFYFGHGNLTDHHITAFADGGGGTVTVTCNNHGLSNSDRVRIENTTNYNGYYTISSVATNTYKITATWVSNDAAGDWVIILAKSRARSEASSATISRSCTVLHRFDFFPGDFIELYIENNTDAVDLVVQECNLLIN